MTESSSDPDPPPFHCPALPVTITPGMPVVEIDAGVPGTIVGFTQAFCIYRISQLNALVVADWRDVALGNVCPAKPLLPADVVEIDRQNAGATVLRALLALKQFGLTATQAAAAEELVARLCGDATVVRDRQW